MTSIKVKELFENGYTILPSLISEKTCNKLKNYLDSKFNTELPYNYYKGHYQIHLPNYRDEIPSEILFNENIHNIVEYALGKNYHLYSYTCNANLADNNQPYHMDCSHFHSQDTIKLFNSPGPPHHIIVNVYLEDTNEANTSFNIVPGSHLFTDFEIDEDGIIDNKYINKTFRCNLPKGSVIIRDKRTWHRGTINYTINPRYMVGFGYSSKWFKSNELKFSKDSEELFFNANFSIWNINFE